MLFDVLFQWASGCLSGYIKHPKLWHPNMGIASSPEPQLSYAHMDGQYVKLISTDPSVRLSSVIKDFLQETLIREACVRYTDIVYKDPHLLGIYFCPYSAVPDLTAMNTLFPLVLDCRAPHPCMYMYTLAPSTIPNHKSLQDLANLQGSPVHAS